MRSNQQGRNYQIPIAPPQDGVPQTADDLGPTYQHPGGFEARSPLGQDTSYTTGPFYEQSAPFGTIFREGGSDVPWPGYSRPRTTTTSRGTGRSGPTFDQALIEENIRSQWRFLMLEEPANLNGLVAEYMGDVRRIGISLNLDAWVTQRARREARYHLLYSRKPAELGEGEYIGQLRGVAEQLGLSGRNFNEQVTAAASAGQSAQGFASRAADIRPVRVGNLGLFSRKVASTLAQLGPLSRGSL